MYAAFTGAMTGGIEPAAVRASASASRGRPSFSASTARQPSAPARANADPRLRLSSSACSMVARAASCASQVSSA